LQAKTCAVSAICEKETGQSALAVALAAYAVRTNSLETELLPNICDRNIVITIKGTLH